MQRENNARRCGELRGVFIFGLELISDQLSPIPVTRMRDVIVRAESLRAALGAGSRGRLFPDDSDSFDISSETGSGTLYRVAADRSSGIRRRSGCCRVARGD